MSACWKIPYGDLQASLPKKMAVAFSLTNFEARKACWDYHCQDHFSSHSRCRVCWDSSPRIDRNIGAKRRCLISGINEKKNSLIQNFAHNTAVCRHGITWAAWHRECRRGRGWPPPAESWGYSTLSDLTRGSKIYFPVYVKDGGLSMGDCHFSQGDGEITFCGGIETAAYVDVRVNR